MTNPLAFAFRQARLHAWPEVRGSLPDVAIRDPAQQLQALAQQLQEQFTLNPSAKHLAHRELGRLEPTAALKYRAAA